MSYAKLNIWHVSADLYYDSYSRKLYFCGFRRQALQIYTLQIEDFFTRKI